PESSWLFVSHPVKPTVAASAALMQPTRSSFVNFDFGIGIPFAEKLARDFCRCHGVLYPKGEMRRMEGAADCFHSLSQQRVRPHRVTAETVSRRGFQGEGECDCEILCAGAVVAQSAADGDRPASQVAVDRIKLFLHPAGLDVEMVRRAKAPVFVHAIK